MREVVRRRRANKSAGHSLKSPTHHGSCKQRAYLPLLGFSGAFFQFLATWVKASLWESEGFLALTTVNCFFMYSWYREGSFLVAAAFLAGVIFLGVDFWVSLPAMVGSGVGGGGFLCGVFDGGGRVVVGVGILCVMGWKGRAPVPVRA